jgi:hypothetical protein
MEEAAAPWPTKEQIIAQQVEAAGGAVRVFVEDPRVTGADEPNLGEWWFGEVNHSSGQDRIDTVLVSGTDPSGKPFTFSAQFATGREILLPQVAIDALENQVQTVIRVGTTNEAYEAAMRGDMGPANKMAAAQNMDKAVLRGGELLLLRTTRQYRFIKNRPRKERIEIGKLPE